jgi:GNAT superfamily N-acetyltransferase
MAILVHPATGQRFDDVATMLGPKNPTSSVCWCLSHSIRVRPGRRGKGISHELLEGAVDYARSQGAPAVEGHPVDNAGAKACRAASPAC